MRCAAPRLVVNYTFTLVYICRIHLLPASGDTRSMFAAISVIQMSISADVLEQSRPEVAGSEESREETCIKWMDPSLLLQPETDVAGMAWI